jgi:ketosteroid isomerase-like protein
MAIYTLEFIALIIGASALLTSCADGGKTRVNTGTRPALAPEKHHAPTVTEQVRGAELAFAKTMADRDFDAFVRFLSRDAIFFSQAGVEHGVAEIAASWQPLFKDKVAPFSWTPDAVEVLGSGDLALSTGVVLVGGKVVGRFNSVWRLESGHAWRVVFDKGEQICATPSP